MYAILALHKMDFQCPYDRLDGDMRKIQKAPVSAVYTATGVSRAYSCRQTGFLHSNDHHPPITLVLAAAFTMIKVGLAHSLGCV